MNDEHPECWIEIRVGGEAFGGYPVTHRADYPDDPGGKAIAEFVNNIIALYYSNVECRYVTEADKRRDAEVRVPASHWGE